MNGFNSLIGRCRCRRHAENYKPRAHNQSRTYFYIPEEHTPVEFLCGACMQNKEKAVHGGLVISKESKRAGIVVFEAFAAYQLSETQINSTQQIWPRH